MLRIVNAICCQNGPLAQRGVIQETVMKKVMRGADRRQPLEQFAISVVDIITEANKVKKKMELDGNFEKVVALTVLRRKMAGYMFVGIVQ